MSECAQSSEPVDRSLDETMSFNVKQDAMNATIDQWKSDGIYPFSAEPLTCVEFVERQVFAMVATVVAQRLPAFEGAPKLHKAFQLRMLRHAIETTPGALRRILDEVLELPREHCQAITSVLEDASMSSVFATARLITDRLRFLVGLESILFDAGPRKLLKERSQLHRIIAQNCWLFGEDFTLSVDDRSLTEVLRAHKRLLGDHIVIDEPVSHPTLGTGIVDLMLSKTIRLNTAYGLMHLVVELKAPGVKVDHAEICQIEKYALTIMDDRRFHAAGATWIFWVISDELGDYAAYRAGDSSGLIQRRGISRSMPKPGPRSSTKIVRVCAICRTTWKCASTRRRHCGLCRIAMRSI